ncbi:helix-turn-helix domain-containing protein [Gemelliphila palaticanis]|uniref:Helix-turn-helix domain-containing protein n=1 Tax=Gemelliphila palaticanis TaxID=81950 RepID=A0ABX2SX06_9BACL|nr:helix-turn-helix domain-containing protein [Gemella palaticanis]MBF0714664.1 helix-turn-helix domain-containing protein [Gemella palaticanis]NYS46594.1 helix-turn-helix domain-containing protein [Gemella palaticanis]
MNSRNRIKSRLTNFRKEHNLTQREISEIIGVHYAQISVWESGKARPNTANKKKLEKMFKAYNKNSKDKELEITKNLKVAVVNDDVILLEVLEMLNTDEIQANGLSSVKLCEVINKIRSELEIKSELLHKNLLAVIKDEFEEEISELKIQPTYYKDVQGKNRPMYNLTLAQAKQVLIRESKQVRRLVIKVLETQEQQILELKGNLINNQIETMQNQNKEKPYTPFDDFIFVDLTSSDVVELENKTVLTAVNELIKLAYHKNSKQDKNSLLRRAIKILNTDIVKSEWNF